MFFVLLGTEITEITMFYNVFVLRRNPILT